MKIKTKNCPMCGQYSVVEATGHQVALLHSGELIQRIFPEMDAGLRERFISGICPECWDKIVEEEEYDEEYK